MEVMEALAAVEGLPMRVATVVLGAAALYPAILIFKTHGAGGFDAKPLGPRLMPTFMLIKAVSFLIFGVVCLAGVTGDSPPTGLGNADVDPPYGDWIMMLGGQRKTWPICLFAASVLQLLQLLCYATAPEAYGGVPGWASASKSGRPWQVFVLFILWFLDIRYPHEFMWGTKETSLWCLRWLVGVEKGTIMTGCQTSLMLCVFGGSVLNDAGVVYSIGAIACTAFQAWIAIHIMTDTLIMSPYCIVIMINFVDVALKRGLSGGIMSQEPLVVRVGVMAAALAVLVYEFLMLQNNYA